MDDALRATARQVRAAMPCSIELPAGAGKTQLVAALAAVAAESQERVLILTHTNAGVAALRRRLQAFGVSSAAACVDTIASWSFALVRSYPVLSGLTSTDVPDWSKSAEYYEGAAAVGKAAAIRSTLLASYDFVVVDEYQDCVVEQNALVLMLHAILPVCVLGDPLQNIFNFGDNVTVNWKTDVVGNWPASGVPTEPWRWKGHNEALGRWLLAIRGVLHSGAGIDLMGAPLTWARDPHPLIGVLACMNHANADGSVVAIAPWGNSCTFVASRTNGTFTMMEELAGGFMLEFARIVDDGIPEFIAAYTLKFGKACIANITTKKLDATVLNRLRGGKSVAHLTRPGAEEPLRLLSGLLTDPSAAGVRETLFAIRRIPGAVVYRREAWRAALRALDVVVDGSDVTMAEALVKARNQTRVIGRAPEQRVIARPLLIKGLEYDHAIVLNAEQYSATELYVALTRGRKSLTVVSQSRFLSPAAPAM